MSDVPKNSNELRAKWNIEDPVRISIGPGWVPVVDALLTRLYALGDINWDSFECKQKMGELRIYYVGLGSPHEDEIWNLIDLAVFEAKETCEHCGKDGKRMQHLGWLGVLCKSCGDKQRKGWSLKLY